MYSKRACFAAAAWLCSTQLAGAQSFNQLIAFGDSTVDTGWYTGASSGAHSTGVASVEAFQQIRPVSQEVRTLRSATRSIT